MKFEEYLIESEIIDLKKELKEKDGYLKAPNGKDTILPEKQWLIVRTKSFKQWFGDWEHDKKNASKVIDENGEPLIVYHGTDKKFNEFVFKGEKLTALGVGFYVTPNLSKAKQYGSNIMELFVNARNILDWGNLSKSDKNKIISTLDNMDIDPNMIAGYGKEMEKRFRITQRDESKKFFDEMKAKTKDYFHDRAKAKVKKDGDEFIITWMTPSFENASTTNLLALIQQYHNDFASFNGYDAVRYMDEIAMFNANQLKSIDNKGSFSKSSNNINESKSPDLTSTPEFKQWFGDSEVVDDSGNPLLVCHGTRESFDEFAPNKEGIHFGSVSQANMRSGKKMIKAYLSIQKMKRVKDTNGSWVKAIKSAKSSGYDGIIYLNRYEGIPYERFESLRKQGITDEKMDSMSDTQFKKLVPEAQDSYITFEPDQIKIVSKE